MKNKIDRKLISAALTGIFSLIISAIVMLVPFHNFYNNVSDWSLANSGLIICATLIDTAFAMLAILLLTIHSKITNSRKYFTITAVSRAILLLVVFVLFWKDWKFIFGLHDFHPGSFLLVVTALLQLYFFGTASRDKKENDN